MANFVKENSAKTTAQVTVLVITGSAFVILASVIAPALPKSVQIIAMDKAIVIWVTVIVDPDLKAIVAE